MELELIKLKITSIYKDEDEDEDDIFTSYSIFLIEKGTPVDKIGEGLIFRACKMDVEEVGRVAFHQEDAYTLGLKLGDVLTCIS